jgi:endoglucanase
VHRRLRVAAGRHTLRLAAAGKSGPNLDALTLRPLTATPSAPEAPPQTPATPAAPFKVEAESAALRGAVASAARAGFTGAGIADYLNDRGDYVRWTVDVGAGAAGAYDLAFRYANGSAADRPLELKVNGAVAAPAVSFAPTGSWTTWKATSATVTLAAGSNVVQLTAVGASGANVDSLAVSPLVTA